MAPAEQQVMVLTPQSGVLFFAVLEHFQQRFETTEFKGCSLVLLRDLQDTIPRLQNMKVCGKYQEKFGCERVSEEETFQMSFNSDY